MTITHASKLMTPALIGASRSASATSEAAQALIKLVSQVSEKRSGVAARGASKPVDAMRLPQVSQPSATASATMDTTSALTTPNQRAVMVIKESAEEAAGESSKLPEGLSDSVGLAASDVHTQTQVEDAELTGATAALNQVVHSQRFEGFAQRLYDIVPVQTHRFKGLIDWAMGSSGPNKP